MTKKINPITQIFHRPFAVLLLLLIAVTAFSGCLSSDAKEGDTVLVYYTGTLDNGTIFDSNVDEQPLPVVLGQHNVISGFEDALYGMKVNETKKVVLQPEEAYGYPNPGDVVVYDKAEVVDSLGFVPEVGEEIIWSNGIQAFKGIITEVTETSILINFNPLAGKVLTFEITVSDIQKK